VQIWVTVVFALVLASACACAISPTASLAHARHGECCAGAPLFAQGAEPGARVGSLEGRPAPARARPGDSVALRGAASRPVHRCRNRRRGSGPPLHGRAQPCTANPEPGRRTRRRAWRGRCSAACQRCDAGGCLGRCRSVTCRGIRRAARRSCECARSAVGLPRECCGKCRCSRTSGGTGVQEAGGSGVAGVTAWQGQVKLGAWL